MDDLPPCERVEPAESRDTIREEREVRQVRQRVEALDDRNVVERKVERLVMGDARCAMGDARWAMADG